jgi:hypothetical protein
MVGITTGIDSLTRTNIWSTQLKDFFEDELIGATKYVDWLTEFPDGDTFNIPSIGQMQINDYEEGQAIRYTGLATGNWTFTITDYKSAATYITDKAKQDLYYASQVEAAFVPKMRRALAVEMETAILAVPNAGQTASGFNLINGAAHRFVGSGTNGVIAVSDFAYAKYALQKANVPMTNLCAIVDPSVALTLSTLTNLTNVSNNPHWEGIVRDGMTSGMRYLMNIYGFDVYESNYLPNTITETIDSKTVTGDGVANYFFSMAGGDVKPIKGAVRQAPRVESERNKDLQRDEYVMTTRYGFGLYRPENVVTVLTDISAALDAVI